MDQQLAVPHVKSETILAGKNGPLTDMISRTNSSTKGIFSFLVRAPVHDEKWTQQEVFWKNTKNNIKGVNKIENPEKKLYKMFENSQMIDFAEKYYSL